MKILIMLLFLFVVAVGVYYVVCNLIRLFTGCDFDEAATKLHNYFNGTIVYDFTNDSGFWSAITDNIRKIIGEKRYEQLTKLSTISIDKPLLSFGVFDGLPTINICTYFKDETEKQILETTLCNLIRNYLHRYGYYDRMIVEWKIRDDLKMPYLQVQYAKNKNERKILDSMLAIEQQKIISQNSVLTDDTDEEDLDE